MQIYVWYIDAMQLSKFSDYALRILVHLAASPDRLLSTRQLAELHDAKYNHLAKVAGWLVQQGYAEAVRGRGGGLRLARDPSKINLGKILRALEADRPLVECLGPGGGTCRLMPACGLSMALQTAQEAFFRALDQYTLTDTITLSPGMSNLLGLLNETMAEDA